MVDLRVQLGGAELPSPVMTASGCAGTGRELHRFVDLARLGAVVTPSVMVLPRSGDDTPRLVETPSGVLSAVGLPGPGVRAFARLDLRFLASVGARTIVSIAGTSSGEFADVASGLSAADALDTVIGVEVNLSCANLAGRGLVFARDPLAAAKVIALVREQLPRHIPVLAKLSADVTDVVAVAQACVKAGADGLVLIHAPLGMVIDTARLRPRLAGGVGGLSGPGIRPVAVRVIWDVRAAMLEGRLPTVPIVGVGGVRTGDDALQLVAAGASAVQVGTAVLSDPAAPLRVQDELAVALQDRGFATVADAVGLAHRARAATTMTPTAHPSPDTNRRSR